MDELDPTARPRHRIRRFQQLRTAATPVVRRFGVLGEPLEVRTNDERIVDLAEAAFGGFEVPEVDRPPLALRIVVAGDEAAAAGTDSDPTPLDARHLIHDTAGHLLSIGLGTRNRAVADLDTGVATATLSEALVRAPALTQYAFVEALGLALCTGGRGYVPVHAAGIVREGVGIVLQGRAGSGKSTLAMAAIRRGFGLLAEDVVFARPSDGPGGGEPLEVWGLPWTHRLLPDAPAFFPELEGLPSALQPNGERKLEIDVERLAPGTAVPRAAAGPVILLERGSGGPTRIEPLDPLSDPTEVEVLWPWDGRWTDRHARAAARLLEAGLARLHVNGPPDEAAEVLEAWLAERVPSGAGGERRS